jgi:hypothetical protein
MSYDQRRAGAGIVLAGMLLGAANHFLRLGLFGRAAKEMMVLSIAAGFLYARFIGPTVDEIRAENERRGRGRRR